MTDSLFNGCRFPMLMIVDNFGRERPAIHVDQSIRAEQVVAVIEALRMFAKMKPQRIQVDNGSEFISKALD